MTLLDNEHVYLVTYRFGTGVISHEGCPRHLPTLNADLDAEIRHVGRVFEGSTVRCYQCLAEVRKADERRDCAVCRHEAHK